MKKKNGSGRTQLKSPAKRVAMLGILAAVTIALNFIESMLPPVQFLPPGAKPGLANVAVMLSSYQFGIGAGLVMALVKAGFVGLTRGAVAFQMSLAGGVLSALVTALLIRAKKKPFGYIGIGVIGSIVHNLGQLLMMALLTYSAASVTFVLMYAPALLLFGIACGIFSGTVLKFTAPLFNKL